ncbi:uncharacterized protein LOC124171763 [Ischnura elegans]|uniref:uncharacterized protein LOC124171763 n=1 Tax=Ischnura elegans TaxID=197161 RepID=UPI001ED8902A|nr:uncharacterized protein LOC124171763 [Ischnura elegans]
MRNAKRKLFNEEDVQDNDDSITHWSDLDSDSDFEDQPPWVKEYSRFKHSTPFVRPAMSTPKKDAADLVFPSRSPVKDFISESASELDYSFESSFWSPKCLPLEHDVSSDIEIIFERINEIKDGVNSECHNVDECDSSAETVLLNFSGATNEEARVCRAQIIVDDPNYSIISDTPQSRSVLSDSWLSDIISDLCFCDVCVENVCEEINMLCA